VTVTVLHPLAMPARVTDVADEVIPAEGYRTPMWHDARRGCVSASEIATVLGIGRFQSPFDLWWSKRLQDSKDDNAAMSRGRRCEPLVLEDFIEEHPHLSLRYVGLVRNKERPWQVATPDAIAYEGYAGTRLPGEGYAVGADDFTASLEPVAVVEAKTDGGSDHWGERGTDQIPVDYKAQVLWQMDTVGVDHAYVPVWIGFAYRCYEIRVDADDIAFMRQAARDFLDSLDGDTPPPIDSHTTTTKRLKSLHATVVDEAVTVPEALVGQYLAAQQLRDAAAARVRLHENRLRAIIGDAQRGVLDDGRKVASRSVYEVRERTQRVGAHTVDKLIVKPVKGTRTHGKNLVIRSVRCTGETSRGTRCRREHVTSAETWTCHTHSGGAR
jgi:putative phage-type endonuclease